MNLLQSLLIYFVAPVLSFLIFLIFVHVIVSWLVGFNIINLRNPTARQLYMALDGLMRPIMAPIQRIVPSFGGLDFSPIIALLLLYWLRDYVLPSLVGMLG